MTPRMVRKPAVKLAGFAFRTNTKDGEHSKTIPRFWHNYVTDGKMEKLHMESFIKSHDEYGACFPVNPKTGEFEYVIGMEVKDGHDVVKEYHVCTIPEALYAIFSSAPADKLNFSSAIQNTWKYIFAEWLPVSEYELASNGVGFELYDDRSLSETGKVCDIYIPLCAKTTVLQKSPPAGSASSI